ncbi:MAG TPA: AAA family ATPase, partial [Ktedonobacterales bacterium]
MGTPQRWAPGDPPPPERAAAPLTCPVFVGRAAELAALRHLLDDARQGAGQIALVQGDAGIGKSRLVAELGGMAAQLGFLRLEGRCFHAERTLPYAPLRDLFRSHFARHPPDAGQPAIAALLAALAPLMPELAPAPLLPALDGEDARQRVVAAIAGYLLEQARRQPLLVIIEDAHWADDLSLALLPHLARRCRQAPLLLLVTLRAEEANPALRQWQSDLNHDRLAHEYALAPLAPPEVEALARGILATSDPLDAALRDTLTTLAEGNPFFTEELLRSLLSSGAVACDAGVWRRTTGTLAVPRSIREIVRQRVAPLSADARQLLRVAAVAGRSWDAALPQRVLGHDDAHLVALLRELIAAQLVVEDSADQFTFRHALIREALYGDLLARERRAVHYAIAAAIEAQATVSALDAARLPELADHYFAAGAWAQALDYAEQAAEQALALHAPRATVAHSGRALEAAQHLGIPPHATLYALRGQAHAALGAFDRARGDHERALELARASDDGALAWQSMIALGFLWAERDYTRAGEWFHQALDLAGRLGDPALRARSLNRLGNWLTNTGHVAEGLRAHQEALALCQEQDDLPGMAATLDLLAIAHGMRGDRVAATEQLGRAIALFRALDDPPGLSSSLAMRAIHSMPLSNETTYSPLRPRDACAQDAAEALRLARQIGSPAGQAFAENALAQTLLSFGEYGPALAHMRAGHQIASEIEHQQWLVATTYGLGLIYSDLDATDDAIAAFAACQQQASALGSAFWSATIAAHLGLAYARRGDLAAAAAALECALPADQPPGTVAERSVALAWGRVLLMRGEPARALRIADHLLASAPGQAPGDAAQPIPHPLLLRGEALLALGRLAEAASALEAARRGAMERHARPLLWRVHRALGHAWR